MEVIADDCTEISIKYYKKTRREHRIQKRMAEEEEAQS